MTVVPAYGRDYKSAKAAIKDWEDGKDFLIVDVMNYGRYTSIRDKHPKKSVNIRYAKNTKVCVV